MWVEGGVGASVATDLADWNPEGGACHRRSCYRLLGEVELF